MYENSKKLFERAQQFIPGGVNSPVRAFKSVGGTPVFINTGVPPTLLNALTGEFTPPGINCWALSNNFLLFSYINLYCT